MKAGTDINTGVQTLERGLRVIDAVADGATDLGAIGQRTGLNRSTAQRLTAALVRERFLRQDPDGYRLGPRLIQLGFQAREQISLVSAAREELERLAQEVLDTVHLVQPEGDEVLYLDKISGRRGYELRSRIGARMPMALTGVGKALMLDMDEDAWRRLFDLGRAAPAAGGAPLPWDAWRDAMRTARQSGVTFDLAENELAVRCVAAPVRDARGQIVAAISVAAAEPWMDRDRMVALGPRLRQAAAAISSRIGWKDPA
ncbi:IclR family transcriptional regulator [Falsirhodobacter sp. 20TX0035]|uniref:IclR family transcriptional regulator n=1 Tax=Falsirhodobacter sp. 20TX0035 TaxID=3022019 RepID=UPI00232AF0DB|nr:IclR family transcriptional regulator [Falsirhodobacter sp. 20TX0035]MDB6452950.1 IclR family transcriptional regulator [Falsirhodobacter sp. 20TX0035]